MDFKKIETLSDEIIFELYNNVVESDDRLLSQYMCGYVVCNNGNTG